MIVGNFSTAEQELGLKMNQQNSGLQQRFQWMTSEIYEEATARVVEENIRMKYFPLLTQLRHEFSTLMKEKAE